MNGGIQDREEEWREGENTPNPNLLASGTGRFTNSKDGNGEGVCVSETEWGSVAHVN